MSQNPDTDDTSERTEATNDGREGLLDRVGTTRRIEWGAIAFLAVLAALATFRIYDNVSRVISTFVAHEYVPIFQAAFNLAVLLLAVAGIVLLSRRVRAES